MRCRRSAGRRQRPLSPYWPRRGDRCLRSLHAPRSMGNTTECYATAPVALDDGSDRNECKRVGRAVPHLAVDMRTTDRTRQGDRGDEFAVIEHVIHTGMPCAFHWLHRRPGSSTCAGPIPWRALEARYLTGLVRLRPDRRDTKRQRTQTQVLLPV